MNGMEFDMTTNLICTLCGGTGTIAKFPKGKPKFTPCVCFGGCLY